MDEKKYRLRYKIDFESGEFTKEDAENKEYGLTDAILLASILTEGDKAHEGALSIAIISVDGRASKLGAPVPQPPTEMFQVWSVLGQQILTEYRDQLNDWQIKILEDTFKAVCERVVGSCSKGSRL